MSLEDNFLTDFPSGLKILFSIISVFSISLARDSEKNFA